ncbi:hypothetical protein AGMMS50212_08160 [Spirochaetia bacterium]|nr:hypothetical protein AGMMS50212_08160 [Spirochaetia bacterium]
MNNSFINVTVHECVHSFKEIAGIDLFPNQKQILKKDDLPYLDFSVMIGLIGKNIRCFIAISMSNSFALAIAKKMTGTQYEKINEDVYDAIGEINNIISGRVKKQFDDMMPMSMSVPTIIHGDYSIFPPKDGDPVFINLPAASPDVLILTLSLDSEEKSIIGAGV